MQGGIKRGLAFVLRQIKMGCPFQERVVYCKKQKEFIYVQRT